MRRWRSFLLVAMLVLAFAIDTSQSAPRIEAQAPSTRLASLAQGWNLVAWTGDAAAPQAALASAGVVSALFTFDNPAQAFRAFRPTGLAVLNDLDLVAADAGVWVFAERAADWPQPVTLGPRTVSLGAGFNLVAWTGPSATPIADALAALGDALLVAYTYDAPAQRFLSYAPNRLAILNNATRLNYGDGVWINMRRAAGWTQPAPSAPQAISSEDGAASLSIPVGALPDGVDPAGIRILPADRGEALAAFELLPDGLSFAEPVTLRLSLEQGVDGAVILLVASDGALELLDTAISEDPVTGALSLSARLSHFSFAYGIDLTGVMDADLALVAARPQVGEQIDATVEIDLGSGASGSFPDPLTGRSLFVFFQPVRASGFLAGGRLTAEGPLDPATVDDLPADRTSPGESAPFFIEHATFTCLEPGAFSLNYTGQAELTIAGTVLTASDGLRPLTPRVVTVLLRDTLRNECGPNPSLVWENVYTPGDDTNVYTAQLLPPLDQLDAGASTVAWRLINSVCGDPRSTGEFSYAYSHGINSAGGEGPLSSCSLPQEDAFSLAFVVTVPLRAGGTCEFTYLQQTARALQNQGRQNVEWTNVVCDLPGG